MKRLFSFSSWDFYILWKSLKSRTFCRRTTNNFSSLFFIFPWIFGEDISNLLPDFPLALHRNSVDYNPLDFSKSGGFDILGKVPL